MTEAESSAVAPSSSAAADGVRQRHGPISDAPATSPAAGSAAATDQPDAPKSRVLGRTLDGRLFHVEETPDMLSSIFRPDTAKTPLDLVTILLLLLQFALYAMLSRRAAQVFFVVYFAFWRISYNAGLGFLLTKQSQSQWIVRLVQQRGWMDPQRCPRISAWVRQQLTMKMGRTYNMAEMPTEYNTWLLFRSMVDVILLNDFTAYSLFGLSCMHGVGSNAVLFVVRWITGLLLLLFNIWVKVDAHRVVKDYAWYWGDCFFLCLQNLVFDGVYEVAPDPMYSIGYAGYYGLSLLTGSYTVLFVSLAAHASQLLFLVLFENPHMERVYGEKRPIAARGAPRSAAPDGDGSARDRQCTHSLDARLFHNDNVVFSHLDPLRATDFLLITALAYALVPLLLCRAGAWTGLALVCVNALFWRVFHSFGLGIALRKQSQSQWIVRHFIKHYHFACTRDAVYNAFGSWKVIYNTSLVMTYLSFITLAAWNYAPVGAGWGGTGLLRHVLGVLLVLLHMWSARSSFRVLGPFGWLYGDFFVRDYPQRLSYTGIYRFLNNPERAMGGAAYFGMALISGSVLVTMAAVLAQLSHWWFLSYVEGPHMRRLYGAEVRSDSGVTKQMKLMAQKNAFIFHDATQHPTVRELQEMLVRAQMQTRDVVDLLLAQSRPRVERIVDDTRALLQQQRDRLRYVYVRVRTAHPSGSGDQVRAIDRSKYSVAPIPSPRTGTSRYHLGETISVRWTAARDHSRRDWIGVYPVHAAASGERGTPLVTRTSSRGRWVGLAEDEWSGDMHSGSAKGPLGTQGVSDVNERLDQVEGMSVFANDRLPWQTGRFVLRYHHDGSHDVLVYSDPFEIYVECPADPFSLAETYSVLSQIVRFALADSPAQSNVDDASRYTSEDPDDLVLWNRAQVKRIAAGIKCAFDVDFSPEVILADNNTALLARNVVEARQLLGHVQTPAAPARAPTPPSK
ncbi:phosphatidylethanolamine N-methyltransferase [Malassezia sp. CBS 17886]|nr:phosphatidylethanolamine N-methyltransferase [Malassezia sp. CBS 17886]